MRLDELKWDRDGLVSAIVQDRFTGELRMLAHANRAALQATFDTGYAHFFSRSRQQLWRKGETSGHTIRVHRIWADCDGDALIYLGECAGPACHTGRETCFFALGDEQRDFQTQPAGHAQSTLPRLWNELEARRAADGTKSYTRSLLDAGIPKINAKIEEESGELARALASEADERVVSEAADVVYHVMVGLLARGVTWTDVTRELDRRFGTSGLAEKAARAR
jgi:phosphoribosyl-ATP pyrophosphohydrolase/phosphoribosyl-AMP cyclohydrolase